MGRSYEFLEGTGLLSCLQTFLRRKHNESTIAVEHATLLWTGKCVKDVLPEFFLRLPSSPCCDGNMMRLSFDVHACDHMSGQSGMSGLTVQSHHHCTLAIQNVFLCDTVFLGTHHSANAHALAQGLSVSELTCGYVKGLLQRVSGRRLKTEHLTLCTTDAHFSRAVVHVTVAKCFFTNGGGRWLKFKMS